MDICTPNAKRIHTDPLRPVIGPGNGLSRHRQTGGLKRDCGKSVSQAFLAGSPQLTFRVGCVEFDIRQYDFIFERKNSLNNTRESRCTFRVTNVRFHLETTIMSAKPRTAL